MRLFKGEQKVAEERHEEVIRKLGLVLKGQTIILEVLNKMDENTQAAIQAVRDAVTNGTSQLAQTISDEAADIKQKFENAVAGLSDPEAVDALNQLATDVGNSFSTLSESVTELSNNVSSTTPTPEVEDGETPVPE